MNSNTHYNWMPMNETTPLDVMAIEPERRLTRPLAIDIDLGSANKLNDDYLRVTSIQGQESVSQLYQFTVELRANDVLPAQDDVTSESINYGLNFQRTKDKPLAQGLGSNLLGKWTRLRVAMPYDKDRFAHQPENASPDWENATPSRFFSGIISSVTHTAPGCYQLAVQSPLFPLTLRNRYTVHKDKTIEGLLAELLSSECLSYHPHFNLQFKLEGAATNRQQDWLQAGESDFDFMQRMLTKASIHFYFIHHQSQLTLVFSNKTTSVQEVAIPGCDSKSLKLRYSYSDIKTLKLQQNDLFCDLKYEVKMVQQTVETVLTRQQAVWETNQVAKYTSYSALQDKVKESNLPAEYLRYRCYAYGVDDVEVEGQEKKIQQQLATDEGTLSGTSTSPLLSPGYTFVLAQPVVAAGMSAGRMPTQFNGRTFVVTKVVHKVSDEEAYSGTIEATEVNTTTDDTKDTLITPFSMQSTHQGSVLAKVLKTSVPKDWRYRDKNNFQTEVSSVGYDYEVDHNLQHQKLREIGCLVQFATDSRPGDSTTHWVALSPTSQTAPEVNAMVMIGRGSNESEIPEIQQVLSSHGQKNIQPPERRANHWSANTSWGSNYSTSYGDGISIRYGNEDKVNLPQAITIVETAYDNPSVLNANFGNTSFNKGTSFNFSTCENGASGLSSASVSQGCSFNESHSKQSYGLSFTECSQNYSKTNKSVSRSYMGTFSETLNFESPSFIAGKIPEQSIIDICDGLPDGTSFNQSHITGKTINLSGTGTKPPATDSYDKSATVYSHSKTQGKVVNKNKQIGNTYSDSTTIGNTHNKSFQLGSSESSNIHLGNSTNLSTTIGIASSANIQIGMTNNSHLFVGMKNDMQTNISKTNSLSTNISDTNSISTTIGMSNTIDTNIGPKNHISTSIADTNSISTNIATSNSLSTNISASNATATNIGVSNNVTTNISANNTVSTTIGITNQTETFIGLKNTTSTSLAATNSTNTFIGATNDTTMRLAASNSNSTNIGASNTTNTNVSLSNTINTTIGASSTINTNLALNSSINTTMGVDFSMSTNIGLASVVENNLGTKIHIRNGPAAIETIEEVNATQSTLVANIVALQTIL
jgi:type VI secretion system secreted protein VgrG